MTDKHIEPTRKVYCSKCRNLSYYCRVIQCYSYEKPLIGAGKQIKEGGETRLRVNKCTKRIPTFLAEDDGIIICENENRHNNCKYYEHGTPIRLDDVREDLYDNSN